MRSFAVRWPLVFALAALLMSGCDQAPTSAPAQKKSKAHLVEAAPVEDQVLRHETVRTGTLAARRIVHIYNQEEGRIDGIPFREGDRVTEGDLLVGLDKRLLESELEKVVATRHQAESDLARVQELWKRKVATEERLDHAKTALKVVQAEESLIRTRLGYAEIRAPFDGVVTERLAEPGDVAPQHTHILTVVDPGTLYTKVSVSELMLPRLEVGDDAEVRIDALGVKDWPARIGRIHPTVDARTRQGIVEVELVPVPPGAAAGQLCRVRLRTPESRRTVLPFAALRRDREGQFVFAIEDGKAVVKRVRTGLRLDDLTEVLEGIDAGQRVVIRGFLDLAPGKAVTVIGDKKGGKGKGDEQPE